MEERHPEPGLAAEGLGCMHSGTLCFGLGISGILHKRAALGFLSFVSRVFGSVSVLGAPCFELKRFSLRSR